jgi:hypothetical protein
MFNLEQTVAEWRRQMRAADIKTPAPMDELEIHLREEIERQMKSGLSAQEAFEAASQRLGQASALKEEFAKTGATTAVFRGLFIPVGMIFLALIAALNIFLAGDYGDGSGLKMVSMIDLLLLSLALPLMAAFKAQENTANSKLRVRTVWTTQLLMGLCGMLMVFSRDPVDGPLIVIVSCLMFAFSHRLQIRAAVALSIAAAGLTSAVATRLLFWRPALVYTNLLEQMLGFVGIGLGVLFLCSWPYSCRFLPVVFRKPVRRRIQLAFGGLFVAWCVMFCDFISPHYDLGQTSQWMVALVWAIMIPFGVLGGIAFGLEEAAHKQTELAGSGRLARNVG